jgi:hypothetical protein
MSMESLKECIDPNLMDLYPRDCLFKVYYFPRCLKCIDPHLKELTASNENLTHAGTIWQFKPPFNVLTQKLTVSLFSYFSYNLSLRWQHLQNDVWMTTQYFGQTWSKQWFLSHRFFFPPLNGRPHWLETVRFSVVLCKGDDRSIFGYIFKLNMSSKRLTDLLSCSPEDITLGSLNVICSLPFYVRGRGVVLVIHYPNCLVLCSFFLFIRVYLTIWCWSGFYQKVLRRGLRLCTTEHVWLCTFIFLLFLFLIKNLKACSIRFKGSGSHLKNSDRGKWTSSIALNFSEFAPLQNSVKIETLAVNITSWYCMILVPSDKD